MAHYTKLTESRKRKFLEALAKTGNVTKSARSVGVSREVLYLHRRNDASFDAAWAEAHTLGIDALEDEGFRRAMNGSDALLIRMLAANKPKYRDRAASSEGGSLSREEVQNALLGAWGAAQVIHKQIEAEKQGMGAKLATSAVSGLLQEAEVSEAVPVLCESEDEKES